MYIALVRFADMQDGKRIYEAGEQYPRPGFAVTDERLAELAGSDNREGKPLIARVIKPEEHGFKAYTVPEKTAAKPRRRKKEA